ncbi:IS256 family transposase (plasmid) [Mesorhizobium sp. AR10]|uniref:IS256 family transposase n=1 Tax=Mesorhizobium sp. AR10 TaxID=2865839 RepID=UPI00215EC758|nr:IS256 family transposase [Mesorhizobium sp. AR10]UVK36000.1 IS256 family transposase [Mesorhizobium sp. AR10]UVK36005.1 IS256 family transposase [Mesorhizobium sp. AR10]UVK36011.1 IS256 family transposase [Mesorhizobium sp. AR10]UVK36037.1 IS256 family transposase [Mesorhizobium sp. AR10]UVK36040.1 IS256 family transposase [Mesorhizobium sp. AR10]
MNAEAVHPGDEATSYLFDNWFDPIEAGLRERVRGFIETMLETELDAVLARPRYGRQPAARSDETTGVAGHRHGSRTRTLTGTFGTTELTVPRARLDAGEDKTVEWKSKALRAYQRRTMAADALIASSYLAGTNTRRVRRALAALFGGAIGKDVVSRTWRKVKTDWDAWNARSLADEPIVRLILDGTVVRVRLDRKATSISLLVVIGVRADGQKILLAVKNMGGETTEAWRAILDDLVGRGLRRPEFLMVDGAPGLDRAIAALWDGVPVQRCTVHKHRNLLAHAPERLHEEISADYTDMIYAATPEEIESRRKAFLRKWRLKCRAVADSLEEAGERLFAFTRLPPSQWKSARTTNAIERLHEEFKRRIKTQTVLPSAETAAMLFWALMASGQISMRKIDGWQTLPTKPRDQQIDLAA